MMENTDNPAARLRTFLLDLNRAARSKQSQFRNQTTRTDALMAEVLGVTAGSLAFWRAYSAIQAMPYLVRTAVNARFDAPKSEMLLNHLNEVEAAFRNPPTTAYNGFVAPYAPNGDIPRAAAVVTLGFCAAELQATADPALTLDQLASIHEGARNLLDEVNAADLDPELHLFLVDHLTDILRAMDRHRITGRRDVEAAADAMVGALVRRPSLLERLGASTVGGPFGGFMSVLGTALVLQEGGQMIAPLVMQAIAAATA